MSSLNKELDGCVILLNCDGVYHKFYWHGGVYVIFTRLQYLKVILPNIYYVVNHS